MTRIAWSLVRAGGWTRSLLLIGATAVTCGLLLAAVSILRLSESVWDYGRQTGLNSLIADPGTRGGTAFAVAMVALAPLLLLGQVVRLGTAARERRLTALRLAGATPAQMRQLGVLEVGIPVSVGALAGILVYLVSRLALGVDTVGLLPEVGPGPWGLAIVVGVALLGVGVGLWADRRLVATPLAVTRRTRARRPVPWGAPLLAAGIVYGHHVVTESSSSDSTRDGILVVVLLVVGVVGLTPGLAWMAGRLVSQRASSVPTLLAARRLEADAAAAGRAAATVGGIGLVAGGVGAFMADLHADSGGYDTSYYLESAMAVVAALLVAMVVATFSLAVHSVETLLDRRRPMATLHVLGADESVVVASQRREITIVAAPIGVLGALLGGALLGIADRAQDGTGLSSPLWWVFELGAAVAVGLLVLGAAGIAVRMVRPWTRRILDPAGLRTE